MRADGQKVLLAVKNMGGESEAAWRAVLDDLVKSGLPTPELVIVDGAPGLDKALAALWSNVPVPPCAETAAVLFWALLASGQITMRKVDGWESLAEKPSISSLTSPLKRIASCRSELRQQIPTRLTTGPDGATEKTARFPSAGYSLGRCVCSTSFSHCDIASR